MQYATIVKRAKKEWHDRNMSARGSRAYSHADLVSLCDAIPLPKHGDEWGKWKLNLRGEPSLDFANGYWMELSTVQTDNGLVEWLKHLSKKVWFAEEPANAGNFINAVMTLRKLRFEKVLRSPIREAVA